MRCLIFSFVLVAATVTTWAYGQVEVGAIVGTVIDPSGAAIAKAKITTTNAATRAKATASTRSDGRFTIQNLPPGHYDVAIEAKGFQKSVSQNVQIGPGNEIRVDMQLEYSATTIDRQQAKAFLDALERAYYDGGQDRHDENGIHACRPGHAMMDFDFSSDTLFCYHISNDVGSEESLVDENTEREGLRACPSDWYIRGIRDTQRLQGTFKVTERHEIVLLCSRRPDVTPSAELKVNGSCAGNWEEARDLLEHPESHGPSDYWPTAIMTGITTGPRSIDTGYTLCANTEPIPRGKVVFYRQCAACHGTDGNRAVYVTRMFKKRYSSPLGSPEVQAMADEELRKIFTAKHGSETSRIKLSRNEIEDLLSYIRILKQ
jgi:mono/diheme cytochrome c family protein